ncbi:MAG: hypothetical protein P9X24_03125 [Candidatus Hatepunaea meridiana]|nr:hypothetical protein [Candidatus Hatepunaea meridiana]
MTNREKIIILWVVFFLGITTHMLLAVLPIFFGAEIAMPDATGAVPASMVWMMLILYLLPIVIIALVPFLEEKWFRTSNFVISILFTLMNIYHPIEHLQQSPVDSRQIVLLTFVLAFSILLNIVSFRWMKEEQRSHTGVI